MRQLHFSTRDGGACHDSILIIVLLVLSLLYRCCYNDAIHEVRAQRFPSVIRATVPQRIPRRRSASGASEGAARGATWWGGAGFGLQLVFSSSATVYGQPEKVPADETARLTATNPYGRTKV